MGRDKNRQKKTNVHHRRCRSNGGSSNPRNLSVVNIKQHESWHCLFVNYLPEKIAQIINEIWLDPDYEFVCQKKSHS